MLLLRNKDQPYSKPLATFATRLCRQRRGREWTASCKLIIAWHSGPSL